jgi:glycosyltransferase involved in cell wall biosynthesis
MEECKLIARRSEVADQNYENNFTIFIGIYNGSAYIDSLAEQLQGQTNQNFKIVVIDNASSDSSWADLQAWKPIFGSRLSLHRNSVNLGGVGSIGEALTNNLIETPWFAWLHQDDYYRPNHIATLIETIKNSPANVVAVCTSMGSMDNSGNKKSAPPRAQWLLKDFSPESSFLANLRTQTLSFPSAAFRVDAFKENFGDWHSPTFSDTEVTLKLCGAGEFRYVQRETMNYRENPESESHVINSLESSVGTALGLARVFTSSQFLAILNLVALKNRGKFFTELISSIEIRLQDSALSSFIKLLATDECCKAWKFNEPTAAHALSLTYASLNSHFTASLIARLSGTEIPDSDENLTRTLRELSAQQTSKIHFIAEQKHQLGLARRVISYMPLGVRKRIFRVYVHLRTIKQPNFYWNTFWR